MRSSDKRASPSLRGSGLKSPTSKDWFLWLRLPLYEGVDWNRFFRFKTKHLFRLPLYEGVDWNIFANAAAMCTKPSPSLRGSGLKFFLIPKHFIPTNRLPLYEGVDWNLFCCHKTTSFHNVSLFTREWIEISNFQRLIFVVASPSLRGSGLKFRYLHTGESPWMSPSLRGSGLKLPLATTLTHSGRLPLYEGVDWNRFCQWL